MTEKSCVNGSKTPFLRDIFLLTATRLFSRSASRSFGSIERYLAKTLSLFPEIRRIVFVARAARVGRAESNNLIIQYNTMARIIWKNNLKTISTAVRREGVGRVSVERDGVPYRRRIRARTSIAVRRTAPRWRSPDVLRSAVTGPTPASSVARDHYPSTRCSRGTTDPTESVRFRAGSRPSDISVGTSRRPVVPVTFQRLRGRSVIPTA